MARIVNSYNPKNVTVVCGGEVMTDFVKESFVSVSMSEEQFSYHVGLDTGIRLYNPNRQGTITITLMQGSPSNVVLDRFLADDIRTGNGYFALYITDNNTRIGTPSWLCSATACWIPKHPDWSYSSSHAQREWTIMSGNLNYSSSLSYKSLETNPARPSA